MELTDPFQQTFARDVALPNLDELEKKELREVGKAQRRLSLLASDDLVPFLALVPYVPIRFLLPLWSKGFDEAVKAGLVQTGPGPAVWGDGRVLWLERAQAESALADLKSRRRDFATLARKSLSEYASRLMQFSKDLEHEPVLLRWTRLGMAAESGKTFHRLLLDRVNEEVSKSQKLGVLWSPEARAWIEVATPFGATLEGAFQAAVGAAKRRFELFHRRAYDRARLRTYFPREKIDQVFLDLLKDEVFWALHFVGLGGTGKTMLIRHLALEVAETHGVAVSRVDFDYLNPNYPKRDPLLLLKALAEEFRLDESSDAVRSFGDFDNQAEVVYRRVEDAARSGEAVHPSLKDEDVRRGVHSFAEALVSLSNQRQPVLILDTCEELAKKQPDGGVPENVQHTLDLLQMVHEEYSSFGAGPGLRVIFSGRRELPLQPFLRVQRIKGFTRDDAEKFLKGYRSVDGREVPEHLRGGIVAVTTGADGHNPYDLDTYAGWACVDKTLTLEKLKASGPLLYIQERIVDRLAPIVRRVFPALATMGRFDSEVVTGLIGDTSDPKADLAEILSQEWIHPDSAGVGDTWRVDDLFRQRVLQYYKVESAGLHDARTRLAQMLPPLTRTRKFDDLTPQLIAACLDVLSDTPVKAAEWWSEMEARIALEAKWDWAAELMQFLEPAPDSPNPLTAAIFATKAAAMLHKGQDPTAAWQVVNGRWRSHPEPKGAARLRWRCSCGLDEPDYTALPRDNLQSVASLLGCFDRHPKLGLPIAADILLPENEPELEAFGHVLMATATRNGENLRAALAICRAHSFTRGQVWLDWIRPVNLKHRILLEAVLAFPAEYPGEFTDLAEELNSPPLNSIDSDRLASALLRSDPASWSPERLRGLYASSLAVANHAPTCQAHRATPPLFVALLEARALRGEVEDTLSEINRLSVREAKLALDVKRALDRTALKIMVRMRLTSEGLPLPETARDVAPLSFIANQLRARTQDVPAGLTSEDALERAELTFLRGELVDSNEAYAAADARQDLVGRFEARMLEALSMARAGSRASTEVEELYAELTRSDTRVPSWKEILQVARTGSVRELLDGWGQRPAVWRPWVVRMLAWQIEPDNQAELAQWIRENDTVTIDEKVRLPAELEFVKDTASSLPSWMRKLLLTIWTIFAGVVGLGLFVGGLYVLFSVYVFGLAQAGVNLETVPAVVSFIGVLATTIWLILKAPQALMNLSARKFPRVEVIAELQGQSPDLNRPLLAPTSVRSEILLFFEVRVLRHVEEYPACDKERYVDLRREFLPEYHPNTFMAGIRKLLPNMLFRVRVELTVDQRTAAAPWEVVLLPGLTLVVRRVTRERRISRLPLWATPVDCRTWGAQSLVTTRKSWGVNFQASFAAGNEAELPPNPKTGVLHIVGVPVDSKEGIAMQLAASTAANKPVVVRCSDLMARYPNMRFCILQAPPAEIQRRLSSDRRNAAILKRMGAELFTAGVAAVITIPVMAGDAADEFVGDIYDTLGSRNGIPLLEAAITRLRSQPHERIAANQEDANEIMTDVCLYAISKVSFRANS